MALGSSAPEIILNVIEIIGSGFVAGDLGPGKNGWKIYFCFNRIKNFISGADRYQWV